MIRLFRKIRGLLAKFGIDGFIVALSLAIATAWLLPGPGAARGIWTLDSFASFGISVIFLFYGISLSPEKLAAGISHWRLHILVHGTTFVLFPVIVYLASFVWMSDDNRLLWLGIFYLAALPSTVSSSVVMVSIARGNIAAAIFNAGISGVIGIFVTPLWMGFFLANVSGESFELAPVLLKLTFMVFVPLALGVMLHKPFGDRVQRNRRRLRYFDQGIILTVVYTSFSESFASGIFRELNFTGMLFLGFGLFGLFWIVFGITELLARALRFDSEDRITALFCGSKKSLVHGTAISKALFAGMDGTGLILLPLMLYHAMQIIIVSIIAGKLGKRETGE